MQIVASERVLFNADEVQARIRLCRLFKQLPGAEEVQTRTEACFTNDHLAISPQGGKALFERVLFDKDIARFFKARGVRKIDIIKHPRMGATLVIPVKLGIGHFNSHVRLDIGKAAILADRYARE